MYNLILYVDNEVGWILSLILLIRGYNVINIKV